jgi:hypothetical protein
MANSHGGHVTDYRTTHRTDNWWIEPAVTAVAFSLWVLYLLWATSQGKYYAAGPYTSPFYAPLLFVDPQAPGSPPLEHALIGRLPNWLPGVLASPAIFTAWMPGVFRLTCYYYRKFYYRSFFGVPPGCAVGARKMDYRGETGLLVIQNLHRYTLYIAIALLPFLFFEAGSAFFYKGSFGVGVGSIILLINAILLSSYTFGCHAWRHLSGGRLNCFSCDGGARTSLKVWTWSTWFNERHQQFAWASLWFILFTDVYIRLLSMGFIPDLNTWTGVQWIR